MQIFEELKARGLIAQVTDEAEIRDLINNGGAQSEMTADMTVCAITLDSIYSKTLGKHPASCSRRALIMKAITI